MKKHHLKALWTAALLTLFCLEIHAQSGKVADMAVGDDWIYPSYHRGGEGGDIHGMNAKADIPAFFEKVVTETRVFNKRHYLFPIPDQDIRRNPKMVQNLGWNAETAEE